MVLEYPNNFSGGYILSTHNFSDTFRHVKKCQITNRATNMQVGDHDSTLLEVLRNRINISKL